jgi:hypothetical protein
MCGRVQCALHCDINSINLAESMQGTVRTAYMVQLTAECSTHFVRLFQRTTNERTLHCGVIYLLQYTIDII